MDLALHLGMTVNELETKMSGVEFYLWQRYASVRMLPWRRMELHMAQLTRMVAVTMGGARDATLSDFLFDPEDETDDPAVAFGYAPHNFETDDVLLDDPPPPPKPGRPRFVDPDGPDEEYS
jgi:hypothetical protein